MSEELKQTLEEATKLSSLFEGSEFSEEFKEKVSTVFEAAVAMRAQKIEAELTESFEAQLNESSQKLMEELTDKLDGYLNVMAEEWFKENQIAIESGIKMDIFEQFVGGMKSLFKECYIEVPEEKVDAFAKLEEKVSSLQEELNSSTEQRIAMKREIEDLKRNEVIAESVKGLTELDAEKLRTLAKDVVFESKDKYSKKLEIIKENFFANTATTGNAVKAVVTDSPVLEEEVHTPTEKQVLSESVNNFVKALDLLK